VSRKIAVIVATNLFFTVGGKLSELRKDKKLDDKETKENNRKLI
jgi:hypothetical protein